jgi:hypothetical protein
MSEAETILPPPPAPEKSISDEEAEYNLARKKKKDEIEDKREEAADKKQEADEARKNKTAPPLGRSQKMANVAGDMARVGKQVASANADIAKAGVDITRYAEQMSENVGKIEAKRLERRQQGNKGNAAAKAAISNSEAESLEAKVRQAKAKADIAALQQQSGMPNPSDLPGPPVPMNPAQQKQYDNINKAVTGHVNTVVGAAKGDLTSGLTNNARKALLNNATKVKGFLEECQKGINTQCENPEVLLGFLDSVVDKNIIHANAFGSSFKNNKNSKKVINDFCKMFCEETKKLNKELSVIKKIKSVNRNVINPTTRKSLNQIAFELKLMQKIKNKILKTL